MKQLNLHFQSEFFFRDEEHKYQTGEKFEESSWLL
jgi:hypothetical protein